LRDRCREGEHDGVRIVDNIDLFSKLEEEDKEKLENAWKKQKYAKGGIIFLEGDPADRLYFVLEGTVSVHLDQRTCYLAHKGDFFGMEGVFSANREHPYAARAEESTRLLTLPSSVFLKLFESKAGAKDRSGRNAKVLIAILVQIHRRMFQSYDRLRARKAGSIAAVANMLNIFLEKGDYSVTDRGKKIRQHLTEEKIEKYCGITRSTVQRVLGQLEEEGIIEKRNRRITILDEARLQKLQYEPLRGTRT